MKFNFLMKKRIFEAFFIVLVLIFLGLFFEAYTRIDKIEIHDAKGDFFTSHGDHYPETLIACMNLLFLFVLILGVILILKSLKRGGVQRYLAAPLFLVIVGSLFLLNFMILTDAREIARRMCCNGNLKSIGLAIRMYSQEYKENFPPYDNAKGLEMLRSGGYLENIRMFACPSVDKRHIPDGSQVTEEVTDYCYKGGLTEASPIQLLMWDKPENHKDFGNVLYSDGAVRGFKGKDWLEKAQKNTKPEEFKVLK